jgi:hypothetical protein
MQYVSGVPACAGRDVEFLIKELDFLPSGLGELNAMTSRAERIAIGVAKDLFFDLQSVAVEERARLLALLANRLLETLHVVRMLSLVHKYRSDGREK